MTDRPIIFSAPMVRALLDGRKTQTRRALKPQPVAADCIEPHTDFANEFVPFKDGLPQHSIVVPFAVGDRLWVRETWRPSIVHWCDGIGCDCADVSILYCADSASIEFEDSAIPEEWSLPKAAKRQNVTPLHMPRWASRLTLTVTNVRVERLQDISVEDCDAECFGGDYPHLVLPNLFPEGEKAGSLTIPECFGRLWNSIHGPGAWDENPWVAAVTFTVARRNIDA